MVVLRRRGGVSSATAERHHKPGENLMADSDTPDLSSAYGLPVYTGDGSHIGAFKEVIEQAFKVDAPMRPDYWLSTESIGSVADGRVTLSIDGNRLHDYRVSEPHEAKLNNPGGIEGRAGVYPNATAAAGLLVPREQAGSDPGEGPP
jgi:hypothetical protein